MIIGTITLLVLLLGGGSFSFEEMYKSVIKDIVTDKDRREQFLDVAKNADSQITRFNKDVKDVWGKEAVELFKNYDSTREDYRKFQADAAAGRERLQAQLVTYRFDSLQYVTEKEWDDIYSAIEKKQAEEAAKKAKKNQDS